MSLFDRLNGQPQMNMQQLQNDPVGMAKQAGYNIPQNLAGNPQAMVQHLIQSGQISNPMLQKIMPMIQRLGGIK
jgi:hypothetical protein